MNQTSAEEYIQRLKALGVRTHKKPEVVYSDLFRVTDTLFLKECHAREAFELEDFQQEDQFQHLYELKLHLEDVLQSFNPVYFPCWSKRIRDCFDRLSNPYLRWANEEPVGESAVLNLGEGPITAAFNFRCGKPGEQFLEDQELLLQKLEQRHFSTAPLGTYRNRVQEIPGIWVDLMKEEVHLLEPEACFFTKSRTESLPGGGSSFSPAWRRKYCRRFGQFSHDGLLAFHNKKVNRHISGPAWQGMLQALRDQFLKREIDISSIADAQQLQMNQCAVLAKNKMHTADELPKEVLEAMIMLMDKEKHRLSGPVRITETHEEYLFYQRNGSKGSIMKNYLLEFFSDYLINPTGYRKRA